jgi:regulatory protein
MNFEIAKEKAIAYLVRSRKTENEVRLKLKKIGCSSELTDKVIKYILELGYIDDNEYVDAYIRQCMRLPNYSIFEIKNKLLQKGIKKDIIEEKLQFLEESDYEKNIIENLINGKLKNMEELKRKQYLYRRGFKNINDFVD